MLSSNLLLLRPSPALSSRAASMADSNPSCAHTSISSPPIPPATEVPELQRPEPMPPSHSSTQPPPAKPTQSAPTSRPIPTAASPLLATTHALPTRRSISTPLAAIQAQESTPPRDCSRPSAPAHLRLLPRFASIHSGQRSHDRRRCLRHGRLRHRRHSRLQLRDSPREDRHRQRLRQRSQPRRRLHRYRTHDYSGWRRHCPSNRDQHPGQHPRRLHQLNRPRIDPVLDTPFQSAPRRPSGTQPTDTATAVLNIAHNPGLNVAALYDLPQPKPHSNQRSPPPPTTSRFCSSLVAAALTTTSKISQSTDMEMRGSQITTKLSNSRVRARSFFRG